MQLRKNLTVANIRIVAAAARVRWSCRRRVTFAPQFQSLTSDPTQTGPFQAVVHFTSLCTLGTRGFSRAQRDNFSAEGRTTSGEAARKTSGPERYDLPFPLNFDLFYRI